MGIVVREIADGLDDEPLLLLERFHGHLGPYVVLGYRMGRFAKKFLGKNPFGLRAEVFTGPTPPISCLVDGIQVGSGCTLGKGNVSIKEGGIAEVHFITDDGRRLRLRAKPGVIERIRAEVRKDDIIEFAQKLHARQDGDLFDVLEV